MAHHMLCSLGADHGAWILSSCDECVVLSTKKVPRREVLYLLASRIDYMACMMMMAERWAEIRSWTVIDTT
jgi:hypothetical protein